MSSLAEYTINCGRYVLDSLIVQYGPETAYVMIKMVAFNDALEQGNLEYAAWYAQFAQKVLALDRRRN